MKFLKASLFFLFLMISITGSTQSRGFDLVYQRCEWTLNNSVALSGKITYYFTATEDNFQNLFLNLDEFYITVDSVLQRDEKINFRYPSYIHDSLLISLSSPLKKGELDSVTILYRSTSYLKYSSSFIQQKNEYGNTVVGTLSEPFYSAVWFPCKNDLTDKVDSSDIIVTAPKGYKVASNGVLVSATSTEETETYHWRHRYPIATYLTAFAVSKYETYSDWYVRPDGDSLEILNYVYPEDLDTIKKVTPITIKAMALFEELYGKYPFSNEKYGHAEFILGGGMEHQTMSFIGKRYFTPFVLTHELAHQWFGNMITCSSWNDIWVNEGFATYSTGLFYEREDTAAWNLWKRNTIDSVTSRPDGSVYCYNAQNKNRIFNIRLSYEKASYVLHMLRWVIGDSAFFKGIWNFANDSTLMHGFASTNDVKKHFENTSGKDLTEFFDSWIYKEGYPNYELTFSQKEDFETALTIKQTPSHSSVSYFKMPVPVLFSGEEKDTLIVFQNDSLIQHFTLNPQFKIKSVSFDPEKKLLCKYKIQEIPVGIESANAETFDLSIYPNPAKDYVILKSNASYKGHWVLKNILGRIVDSGKITNSYQEFISLKNCTSGVYFLQLEFEKGSITRKIVVIK